MHLAMFCMFVRDAHSVVGWRSYFGSGWTALSQVSFCYDNSLKLIECQYDVKNNRGGGVTNCDDNGSENIYIPSTAWANGNF